MPVTRDQVEQFFDLEEQRRDFERRANALQKITAALKPAIIAHVERHGGDDRTTVFHGHKCALISVAGVIRWKEEFVSALGAEAALEIKAPKVDRLIVERLN